MVAGLRSRDEALIVVEDEGTGVDAAIVDDLHVQQAIRRLPATGPRVRGHRSADRARGQFTAFFDYVAGAGTHSNATVMPSVAPGETFSAALRHCSNEPAEI